MDADELHNPHIETSYCVYTSLCFLSTSTTARPTATVPTSYRSPQSLHQHHHTQPRSPPPPTPVWDTTVSCPQRLRSFPFMLPLLCSFAISFRPLRLLAHRTRVSFCSSDQTPLLANNQAPTSTLAGYRLASRQGVSLRVLRFVLHPFLRRPFFCFPGCLLVRTLVCSSIQRAGTRVCSPCLQGAVFVFEQGNRVCKLETSSITDLVSSNWSVPRP